MGKLNNARQKIKGKLQQMKGTLEAVSGQQTKGYVDKLRGKANEIEADIKGKVENSKK